MFRFVSIVFALLGFAAVPAQAQDYPSRPIRILVPYAPGGISDIAARIVGGKLTEAWGQQVIVENRPGGNGFIAVTDAARSTPDGYTLVMVTTGDVAINPVLFKDIPYDVDRDLVPISAVSDAPMVLATNGDSPYKTVADVLAAAKAQPGTLNVCSPGYGTINQIVLEAMALNTGTKFVHVPYKGGAPAAQALVAGDIPLGVLASSSVAPHVAVKEAVFPFARFPNVDTILGPEMKSTGEVMGIDSSFERAFAKSQLGAGIILPQAGTVFLSIRDADKKGIAALARRLTEMGFSIVATRGTAGRIRDAGLPVSVVNKVLEGRPHCVDAIRSGEIQLVINTASGAQSIADSFAIRRSALTHGVPHYTTMAGARAAVHAIAALKSGTLEVAPLQSYFRGSF